MLSLPAAVRVYLAPGATDMRKSFDALQALVDQVLGEDPFSGHLFAFCNRRQDRVKILCWDRHGFVLYYKRLEAGTFAWPAPTRDGRVELTPADLSLLLEGIELESVTRRPRYQRPAPNF